MKLNEEILVRVAEDAARRALAPKLVEKVATHAARYAARRAADEFAGALESGNYTPSPWMNTRLCAAYIGISHHHLAKLREHKKGPPHRRHGRLIIYDRGEVDAYLHGLPRR